VNDHNLHQQLQLALDEQAKALTELAQALKAVRLALFGSEEIL
jgi:hypothetical protein